MFAVNSLFREGFYSIFICSKKIQSKKQAINQPNNISIKRNITTLELKKQKENNFK